MGAVERRTKQREELRASILAAARGIVLREGYRSLTMRRIAEAIEYSPAAIYQYFESRDAIAAALMDEGFEQLAAAFEPLASTVDPLARLEAVARAYVAFGLDHPETYRLMFMEDPEITATVLSAPSQANAGERAYAAIITPVGELAARAKLHAGLDVQATADALWSALHGLVSLRLSCPKFPVTPNAPLLDTLVTALFHGISASEPARL
jgi:AcrR family transcriptional regulator